jgi:WD40 repeat protein
VLSASADQQVKIWQRSGELVRTIDDFDEPVRELVASPTGYFFVAASKNKLVVYDFAGNQRYTYTINYIAERRYPYFYPLFTPDGSRIVFKIE